MICYAIKNEEGNYLRPMKCYGQEDVWGDFTDAQYWHSLEYPKIICPTSCKVVKVEIREVEDDGGVK